jgi:hypothetical protein
VVRDAFPEPSSGWLGLVACILSSDRSIDSNSSRTLQSLSRRASTSTSWMRYCRGLSTMRFTLYQRLTGEVGTLAHCPTSDAALGRNPIGICDATPVAHQVWPYSGAAKTSFDRFCFPTSLHGSSAVPPDGKRLWQGRKTFSRPLTSLAYGEPGSA